MFDFMRNSRVVCLMAYMVIQSTRVCLEYGGEASALPFEDRGEVAISVSADLSFKAPASGGQILIMNIANERNPYVMVQTEAGQSVESVTKVLQSAIVEGPMDELMPTMGGAQPISRQDYADRWSQRGSIILNGAEGEIVLGGTENGLGILPPVSSFSAHFDVSNNQIVFRWIQKCVYSELYVCQMGVRGGREISNSSEVSVVDGSHKYSFKSRELSNSPFYYVVGFNGGVPTNASRIRVNVGAQCDSFFFAFTNNLAPNWTGWKKNELEGLILQERRFDRSWLAPPLVSVPRSTIRSAEVLSTIDEHREGGMYRFFIAQTPGRIYRPALRCHIMEEAEDFKGAWAFEIMTGVVDPERAYEMDNATRVMTADSWAEFEANGEQISKWRFDHTMPRTDEWIMNQTGAQDSDIPQKDIVLGDSKTAVFFCVRLTGHKPNGIAMDGVRLVDVTDGFPNAKIRETAL